MCKQTQNDSFSTVTYKFYSPLWLDCQEFVQLDLTIGSRRYMISENFTATKNVHQDESTINMFCIAQVYKPHTPSELQHHPDHRDLIITLLA